MKDYKAELEKAFQAVKEWDNCPPESKYEFLTLYVFDVLTYDSAIDEYFGKKIIEIFEVIVNRSNFEYIEKSKSNYLNFIIVTNIPFLRDKLEWGGSIRGCWLDSYCKSFSIDTVGLIVGDNQFENFVIQMIEWVKT